MKVLFRGATLLIICTIIFMTQNAYGMILVQNGKPNANIIISSTCPNSVRFAASEFQMYIKKITGAEIPIIYELPDNNREEKESYVLIGKSKYTEQIGVSSQDLKPDGFKIISRGDWLVIMGSDYNGRPINGLRNPWRLVETYNSELKISAFGETGTLYGVYHFLKHFCGVRWYMPGEIGEVIRGMNTLRIPETIYQESPDFEYRYVWLCDFSIDEEAALWYRRIGFGAPIPVQIIDSFHFFQKYKNEYPGYFAFIDGQRDFTNLSCLRGGGNLCLSNPDVFKQWVVDINKYFDKHPDQKFYPVVPNDGLFSICECLNCQSQINKEEGDEGKFSNYIWGFVDKVAREVYKSHPDKFIGCLAYGFYAAPPAKIEKLNSNVVVMICKWRMLYNDTTYRDRMNNLVMQWHKKTKNIYIWEYYLNSWGVLKGLPVFFPHVISTDLKYLKEFSKGEFIEAESWKPSAEHKMNFTGMMHLNLYITGKLFWNTNEDVDEILSEYYSHFYGPAEEEMKSFWTLAEKVWMKNITINDTSFSRFLHSKDLYHALYSKEVVLEMRDYLQKALSKTPNDSKYHKRINLIYSNFVNSSLSF